MNRNNAGRFAPGPSCAAADEQILKTQDNLRICKLCLKVFPDSSTADNQRSARRHVLDYHKVRDGVVDEHNHGQMEGKNMDLPYANDFENLEAEELFDSAGDDVPAANSFPAVLFGLMYLRFGFSEREADAVLRLLKLKLDFTDVRNAKDVLNLVGVADSVERAACRQCNLEGSITQELCSCDHGCDDSNIDRYITGDLSQQLMAVCKGEKLHLYRPDLFRASRRIRDVTDGKGYRHVQEKFRMLNGVHSNDLVLVLIASTDGVAIFNSSTQSLWPVFMTICELPPTCRFRSDKIVTYALWRGNGKPPLECIVANLKTELDYVNHHGLFIDTLDGRKRIYVTVAAITGDLQARTDYMNMVSVRGAYSCPTCEIVGKIVPKGLGTCRQYLPEVNIGRRTDASIRDMGFYGEPRIHGLEEHLDYGSGILLDAMHGVCLGVGKSYTSLLFNGSQQYLTIAKRLIAQKRYRQFFPPPTFNRNPVQISTAQWKASDFQNWIIHYSIPCLKGLLEVKYLRHWTLLVDAYTVLNSSDIREDDLIRADNQLLHFCTDFSKLFGSNEYSSNVHGLTHLAEMVDSWGPLFCYDMFAFESKNGWLTRHSHSTHNVTRSLMKPLLGSQILQRKSNAVSLPGELSLLKLLQGKRQSEGTRGENWMTWSALQSIRPSESALTPDHQCSEHALSRVNTATIGNVAVWTQQYRRPRRTMARFFLLTDTRTQQKMFVENVDLVICKNCGLLYFIGKQKHPEFFEPNRIQLSEMNTPNIIISAHHLDLQEAVTSLLDGALEISLVEKSRYSD